MCWRVHWTHCLYFVVLLIYNSKSRLNNKPLYNCNIKQHITNFMKVGFVCAGLLYLDRIRFSGVPKNWFKYDPVFNSTNKIALV